MATNGTNLLFLKVSGVYHIRHIIWQILKYCPGAHNIHDDKQVVATIEEGHDKNGLTLNYQKCRTGVTSMVYLQNTLFEQGLQVSSDKVEDPAQAINHCKSFLGPD